MLKVKKIFLFSYCLLPFLTSSTESAVSIDKYNPQEDAARLEDILNQHAMVLLGPCVGTSKVLEYFATAPNMYVLKKNDSVVGFVNCTISCITLFGFVLYKQGSINGIAVDTAHQRSGYGKILLNHGIAVLKQEGVTSIFAYVHDNNNVARAFFTKAGFCYKKSIIGQNLTEVLLEKKLDITFDRYIVGNILHRYQREILTAEAFIILGFMAYVAFEG
jgi:ribosomal protein S18 acetylase RimI-like enzyme